MTPYTDHPDYKAMLAGILATPDDDLPRLVLADWLDELQQDDATARAEFIRLGVQIESWGCTFKQTPEQPGWNHLCGTDEKGYWLCQPLRSRERALLAEHAATWLMPSPTPFPPLVRGSGQHGWSLKEVTRLGERYLPVVFRRGFPTDVRCTLADWIGGECGCGGTGEWVDYTVVLYHGCTRCRGTQRLTGIGPAVVAAHPVESVRVTDREPRSHTAGRWWYRFGSGADDLPDTLIPHLSSSDLCGGWSGYQIGQYTNAVWFPTREAALSALSTVLIAWAKIELFNLLAFQAKDFTPIMASSLD